LCEIKGTQAFMMNHALAAQAWPWHLGDSSWHNRERNNNQFWGMCFSSRGTQEPNVSNLTIKMNDEGCLSLAWQPKTIHQFVNYGSHHRTVLNCFCSVHHTIWIWLSDFIYLFHWRIPFTEESLGMMMTRLLQKWNVAPGDPRELLLTWKIGDIKLQEKVGIM
jgi:hypothetical protein